MQADFRPNTTHGRNSGYALAIFSTLLSVGLFWLASQTPANGWQTAVQIVAFLLIPFAIYLGGQAYQFSTLRYELQGHNLVVRHGRYLYTYNVRLAKPVPPDAYSHVSSFGGLRWPGCFWGSGHAMTAHEETVPATFFATAQLEKQFLLETPEHLLGLSPADAIAFAQAIAKIKAQEQEDGSFRADTVLTPPSPTVLDARELGEALEPEPEPEPIQPEPATPATTEAYEFPLWPVIINGVVWLIVLVRWWVSPTAVLPAPSGLPAQMGDTAVWFVMPIVGLMTLLVNALLAHRLRPTLPQLAYLLHASSVAVQLLILMTLIPLFR